MEKIKITKEQEEALKTFKRIGHRLSDFINHKNKFSKTFNSLLIFTPEQFALLLCGWYEVEQPFKVGDWVINKYGSGDCYKISEEFVSSMKFLTIDTVLCEPENFKKVEEPWKIMLLELGRDKPEFKVGDKYDTCVPHTIQKDGHKKLAEEDVLKGKVKYFYPVESRIEVKQ